MHFVPIPMTVEHLKGMFPHWYPFLPGISRRSKEPVQSMVKRIAEFDVHIALVWDAESKQAQALIGMQFFLRGNDLIGEIIWLTGRHMKQWRHLLPDMERYLKEKGCVEIRPICRPGWSRFLKTQGYRMTHMVMTKVLS